MKGISYWARKIRAGVCFGLVLVLGQLASSFARAENVLPPDTLVYQVVTANVALARFMMVNIVPLANERIRPQFEAFDALLKPPFVLQLQEVWGKSYKRAYAAYAKQRGWYVAGLKNGGDLLTISSDPIIREKFHQFSKVTRVQKYGVLETVVMTAKGPVRLLNTHTVYSNHDVPKPLHILQLKEVAHHTKASDDIPSLLTGDINVGPMVQVKKAAFDVVKELWLDGFLQHVNGSWRWAGPLEGPTWHEENPLVAKPSNILHRLKIVTHTDGWGYGNSQLDHVLHSRHFSGVSQRVVGNLPVEVKDAGVWSVKDQPGKTMLSDHYFCEAILVLKNP